MRESLSSLRSAFVPFIALVSFALVCYGVSLISYPAAFIVGGVLLFLAVLDSRRT